MVRSSHDDGFSSRQSERDHVAAIAAAGKMFHHARALGFDQRLLGESRKEIGIRMSSCSLRFLQTLQHDFGNVLHLRFPASPFKSKPWFLLYLGPRLQCSAEDLQYSPSLRTPPAEILAPSYGECSLSDRARPLPTSLPLAGGRSLGESCPPGFSCVTT